MRLRPSKIVYGDNEPVFHPSFGYGYHRCGDRYNAVVFFEEVGLKAVYTKNLEPAENFGKVIPMPKTTTPYGPKRKTDVR